MALLDMIKKLFGGGSKEETQETPVAENVSTEEPVREEGSYEEETKEEVSEGAEEETSFEEEKQH